MTNVKGVLDKDKKLIEEISSIEILKMIKNGTITEGMIPKINTCLDAINNGVTAVGIIDGRVDNVHEYQDALGFTEIALRWTRAHLRNNSLAESELLSTNLLKQKLERILVMWPDLVPSAEVPFDSSMLFGLSADIEIMILSL